MKKVLLLSVLLLVAVGCNKAVAPEQSKNKPSTQQQDQESSQPYVKYNSKEEMQAETAISYALDCYYGDSYLDTPSFSQYSWYPKFSNQIISGWKISEFCFAPGLNKVAYLKYLELNVPNGTGYQVQSQLGIYDIQKDSFAKSPAISHNPLTGCGNLKWLKNNKIEFACSGGDAGVSISDRYEYDIATARLLITQECINNYDLDSGGTTSECVDKSESASAVSDSKATKAGPWSENNLPDGISILREQVTNEILTPTQDQWWNLDVTGFIQKFYQASEDKYDFVVVFPMQNMRSHFSFTVNSDVKGIGLDSPMTNPHTKKLLSLVVIDGYRSYAAFTNPPFDENTRAVVLHEIAHHWLDYINSRMGWNGDSAHYPYTLDLFSGDTRYVDPMAYYQWINKDGQFTCVNGNLLPHKFSKLSLYLMGVIPASSVQPVYFHELNQKPGDDHYNMWGPNCEQGANFSSTKTITIQDIIQNLGPRSPSSSQSLKNFKVKFVILVGKNQDIPPAFIDYVNQYKKALPSDWNKATEGLSTISF